MQKFEYVGLDIAAGPVDMVKLSAKQMNVPNAIGIQGSALNLPFGDSRFDCVVAIGSLHHTGNLDKAIEEVFRVLKPGGHFIGMVYNIFSFRNFVRSPLGTFRLLFSHDKARLIAGQKLRWMSDHDSTGVAAPTTEYLSKSALKRCLNEFSSVTIDKKNLDETPFIPLRKHLIHTKLASKFGLDLYFSCIK
jgi:ubiquinone/menaquinone biosynthesis C-methylase UbiE